MPRLDSDGAGLLLRNGHPLGDGLAVLHDAKIQMKKRVNRVANVSASVILKLGGNDGSNLTTAFGERHKVVGIDNVHN